MAKQRKRRPTIENNQKAHEKKHKQPKLTRFGYVLCLWIILIGLAAQIVMAVIVYPTLPPEIPSGWAGSAVPYNTIPSWLVFFLFPLSQIALLVLAIYSPCDSSGRKVMESGKATSLILLAVLFTALQASTFHLSNRLR